MSVHDRAAVALLAQIALTADGALFGLGVAYVAYRTIRKLAITSSALRKIRDAPSVSPSDLRALLSSDEEGDKISDCGEGKLVLVRGSVESKSTVDGAGNWKGFMVINGNSNAVVSHESGDRGVILQRTETCVFNEWSGLFRWTSDLRSILTKSWKERQGSSTIRTVPFVLVETGKWPHSDYTVVNMEGSRHPLPLTTVYHHFQPITATPFTLFQALVGLEYPVGLLYEEKILPLGKDITAVGTCYLKKGFPEIRSCKDLPYFLSDLTKDQMVADLSFKTKVLTWSGLVLGSLALGILGYSTVRNWMKWRAWRRRGRQQNDDSSTSSNAGAGAATADDEEEAGDVENGELCVICLMRRRRSAFVPCGHLVCCQRCALSVERELSPKCPVCRQHIRSSVRIYDS